MMKKLAKVLFVFSDMFCLLFLLCALGGIWLVMQAESQQTDPLWLLIALCVSVAGGALLLLLRKAWGLIGVLLPCVFWLQDAAKILPALAYIVFVLTMMALPYLLTMIETYLQKRLKGEASDAY